jgi:hypothetical protein
MPGVWAGHPMYWFFIFHQALRCGMDAKKTASLPKVANQPVFVTLTRL